jgi:hypothetical protein
VFPEESRDASTGPRLTTRKRGRRAAISIDASGAEIIETSEIPRSPRVGPVGARAPPADSRITCSVADFMLLSGLSRPTIYRMLKRVELLSVHAGRKRLIIIDSYRDYIARQLQQAR